MINKRTLLIIALALGVFILGWFALSADKTATPTSSNTTRMGSPGTGLDAAPAQTPTDGKLYIGDRNAKVTIVEYADYKCPSCSEFHQKAGKEIRAKYVETGKAKIEFRPFPVFGEDAGLALYGSYCANEQGLFTNYHDAAFNYMWEKYYKFGNYDAEKDQSLNATVLSGIATSAGLEKEPFDTCLAGKTHKTAYDQAVRLSASDSVSGTPTFIIGNEKVVGPQPFNIFKVLIDLELLK